MGIWVGLDENVPGGHQVCPIEWDSKSGLWIVYPVVTSTTVKVYDRVFPLRMGANVKGKNNTPQFEDFVEKCFSPMQHIVESSEHTDDSVEASSDSVEEQKPVPEVHNPVAVRDTSGIDRPPVSSNSDYDSSEVPGVVPSSGARGGTQTVPHSKPDYSNNPYSEDVEVECIENKRIHKGTTQYKVKWSGWDRRYNCWKDSAELDCDELIQEYNDSLFVSEIDAGNTTAGVLLYDVCRSDLALCVQPVPEVLLCSNPLPGLDSEVAIQKLLNRHGLEGEVADWSEGYLTELAHMISRRLSLIEGAEEDRIRATSEVVTLRMILASKKDGRKKGRLVLQGFKEPLEWDLESNVTPVASMSAIRTLVFMGGNRDDVLSSIDVSVAFLQADAYKPGEPDRYVEYKPYAGGRAYLFKLLGPIYGQRSAPRAWYKTVTAWLVGEMGYQPGYEEEVHLFRTWL
jgi:hypothetical protein